MMGFRRVVAGAFAALFPVLPLGAAPVTLDQEPGLRGTVVEAGGDTPVPGVLVEWSGETSGRTVTTTEGRWATTTLPPGTYVVRASALGFATAERTVQTGEEAPALDLRFELERQALPLDALVVTASRRLQRLADSPVTTEVIQRDELEATGAADLADVLVERTGIQLQGGHPTGSGIMLQGMDSRRILVLVDGQPWVGRLSGDIDLARLPTAGVERVEIVKGPQSTLYGSEAMGGVVNVITRTPGADRWEAGGQVVGGSGGRLDTSLRGEWGAGPVSVTAGGGRRSVDRVPGLDDVPGAGVSRLDAHGRVRWGGDDRSLSLSFLAVDEDQQWRTGQLTQFADTRQWNAALEGTWTRGHHRFAPAITVATFDHLSRQGLGGVRPAGSAGRRQLQRRSEVELIWAWIPEGPLSLDGGMEVRRETLEAPDLPSGRLNLDAVEPFFQGTLEAGPVTLVPGIRMSWSQEWGSHASPRLAALFRPGGGGWALRASMAGGYRAPDGKELGLEFLNVGSGYAYLVRGNPDLRPERSTNVSGGVEWTGRRVWARSQIFHTRFERFIETRAVGDSSSITVYTYDNLMDGWTRGLEVEAGGSHGAFRGEAGWSFLETRDEAGNGPLLGRPRHSGRLSVQHTHPSILRTSLTGIWTGESPLSRDASGAPVVRDAFFRLDARVSRRFPGDIDLALGVDNLLNAAPAHWPGTSERAVHLSVSFQRGGIR